MTHLSSEAERLAGLLEQWARDYAGTTYEEDTLTQSAALLRRIPELEAERDKLRAELEHRFNWMPLPTQEGDK